MSQRGTYELPPREAGDGATEYEVLESRVEAALERIAETLEAHSTMLAEQMAVLVELRRQGESTRRLLESSWNNQEKANAAAQLRDEAILSIVGDLMGRMGDAGLI